MAFIKPQDWTPIGIESVEPAADQAIRAASNTLVVAGPGAGKTELLAQRVCYLLQTGFCPPPCRILAISFKRDAAKNLGDRVAERCDRDLARRFDSLTFDAFAKSVVDRFLLAIPEQWRPSPNYEIGNLPERDVRAFLDELPLPPGGNEAQVRGITERSFIRAVLYGRSLPVDASVAPDMLGWIAHQLWRTYLARRPSYLSFPMIERLAKLVFRSNPSLLRALRATYSHVCLDEFQDTTAAQYDVLRAGFLGSSAVVSAVGDNKQRIMVWAFAMQDAFDRFRIDFSAEVKQLVMNYRSTPELVRVQQYIMKSLDSTSIETQSAVREASGQDGCRVLVFSSDECEAATLSLLVLNLLSKEGLGPRDICILVRNRAEAYAQPLVDQLRASGIKARVEAELQDLLSEPLTALLLSFLRIATVRRAPADWSNALEVLCGPDGEARDTAWREAEASLAKFSQQLHSRLDATGSEDDLAAALQAIVTFVGEDAFKLDHPQYRQGNLYESTIRGCAHNLWKSFSEARNWPGALADFEGVDSIPVMTIHKSKGLEYHTVIFLGLEDGAFWSFRNQPEEETCAFVVAFSRAKHCVVFTFSHNRRSGPARGGPIQSRTGIGALYGILEAAGVPVQEVNV